MEISDFLSTRTNLLFEKTESFLRDLIPGFIEEHVIPVLKDYKSHVEETPELEKLSAEKFLEEKNLEDAFIDFKCYWKIVALMEEWAKI